MKMDNKTFIVGSIFLILIISFITSLIGVKIFQENILLAPYGAGNQGLLDISDVDLSANVIIIDDSIDMVPPTGDYGITDTIDFGAVQSGTSYLTDNTGVAGPYPFLLRNEGNYDARVDARFGISGGKLFDYSNSKVYLWVEDADGVGPDGIGVGASSDPGWKFIDDCDDAIALGVPGCLNAYFEDCVANQQSGCELQAETLGDSIKILDSLNYENCRDEAYLHIGIEVDNSEIGVHSATLEITGSSSNTNTNYASEACWIGY
jgi:hypothetical protein